jgi:hypothetical protein
MARGDSFTIVQRLVVETCCNCGMPFAMPEEVKKRLLEEAESGSFYCPLGHGQHYLGKSLEQQLREARNEAAKERDNAVFWKFEEGKRKREVAAAKREATCLKKRAAAGVCPCCNRSFVQLTRHMTTQHPDYAAAK